MRKLDREEGWLWPRGRAGALLRRDALAGDSIYLFVNNIKRGVYREREEKRRKKSTANSTIRLDVRRQIRYNTGESIRVTARLRQSLNHR